MYSKDIIDQYKNNICNDPHVYTIAINSYNNVINFNKDQSILVSGESGAGKTQATKIMLECITNISGKDKTTEDKIISCNPILEAFGNAKTIRNDNSSRFGKFIRLSFDNYKLNGAKLNTYLLEKIRLIYQGDEERNFHIFYYLIKGLDDETKQILSIKSIKYNYLNNGYIERNDNVSDKDEFNILIKSFKNLNIDDQQINYILKITSGILNLGNINFDEEGNIENTEQLNIVSNLLNIDFDILKYTLSNRKLNVSGETYDIKLKKNEAIYTRDSFSMKLYQDLFDYIVSLINNSLNNSCKTENYINILDIFGFESIQKNSFEQLCINYTNENLQNQFNKYIFKLEQEEYKKENIKWNQISFPDNQECLNLIQSKFGILSMLDEECRLPKGNDLNYTSKLVKKYDNNIYFEKQKRYANKKFGVNHYAGTVIYDTDGFCEKIKI